MVLQFFTDLCKGLGRKLLLFFLFGATTAWSTEKDCGKALRSLGAEWEVQGHTFEQTEHYMNSASSLVRGFRPDAEYFLMSSTILAASEFPRLFTVWGRGSNGVMIENFIPESVVANNEFQTMLQKTPKLKSRKVEGGLIVENYSELAPADFSRFIEATLGARGKNASQLYLAKSSSAWTVQNSWDAKIDERVHEEWRGVDPPQFVGLEFVMKGGVKSAHDLKEWYRNLWLRLGTEGNLAGINEPLRGDRNHIHWRMHLAEEMPSEQKVAHYRALKNYWAEANDVGTIRAVASPWKLNALSSDGELKLIPEDLYSVNPMSITFRNISIRPLTASLYRQVGTTEHGIFVKDGQSRVDPRVDPSFPPEFKRLYMGLRSPKEVAGRADGVVKNPELEARMMGDNTHENLLSLPRVIAKSDVVDSAALLKFSPDGSRGLEDDPLRLSRLAREAGLNDSVFQAIEKEVDETHRELQPYCWDKNQILATMLLPLNRWLEHPAALKRFKHMTALELDSFTKRYKQARIRYANRINALYRASQDPTIPLAPDWLGEPTLLNDGKNRFARRGPRGEGAGIHPFYQQEVTYSNDLFELGVWIEMHRFVKEAGLEEIVYLEQ